MKYTQIVFLFFLFCRPAGEAAAQGGVSLRAAPAPLFRDPVTDGAADPVMIYNEQEKSWWMLYTQRRANQELPDVAFCYGNPIAIASTDDHGKTWVYRGTIDLAIEPGTNTFWAPDVVYKNGVYHLFVTYIRGVRSHWGGDSQLAYYTSKDLWHWKFQQFINVGVKNVIDGCIMEKPGGGWRMWYKGPGAHTYASDSRDLKHWTPQDSVVIDGAPHEGPNVFAFAGYYWMLTDEWSGMRVYRSSDLETWEKQGMILSEKGRRPDDSPTGAHGDAVVAGGKAYVFYFTHPGRKTHFEAKMNASGIYPFEERRSSIQVAALVFKEGTLVAKRDEPFDFWLP
ncbi:glycoside hydrolase family protein [Niabella drilacis]|uniref:Glycosyl hydrolases family 32 N-terminal domain-containing protein n=1 Tax=Niabella drilacis (strain DSM 25811 / CCM 8410 / CCUG 62505 / LMG 26954 / E90) TaxID=1285928 RepID=A0A1G6TZR4_NIADE|nr:glycosyl hydrolase [Niabella drilacis]SDD33775.1 Glycosyl hydrolases family 32 N-terminal domain-containing protein [Niabella drilacis]